ncbi:MAG: glycosyltransferase family 2 protein [Myxococcales bacterium]|nr:glycosyltransferase family 2 protein [Myxococcales bacterium]
MFKGHSVSVVIPTWNEARGIAYTLRTVPSLVDEVVVVDASSTDGTADIARQNGATVVTELRRGYGRAFKTGFNTAKGDFLVSADGDGTYPLGVLPDLLEHVLAKGLMFTSCARFPLVDPGAMRPRNKFGNRVISAAASLVFLRDFNDVLSGMWAMRREAWVQLDLVSDSWNFSEEIKIRAAEQFGALATEFPIRYAERLGETKLAPFRVGIENLIWLGLMRANLERQVKALVRPKPKKFDQPDAVSQVASQPDDAGPVH